MDSCEWVKVTISTFAKSVPRVSARIKGTAAIEAKASNSYTHAWVLWSRKQKIVRVHVCLSTEEKELVLDWLVFFENNEKNEALIFLRKDS
jgi:hypothetical protein